MYRICIFCGARNGSVPKFREAAIELGRLIAENNFDLVYGGANVGLMSVVADAALQASGKVIGVIPEKQVEQGLAHNGLTTLKIVKSMHERKAMMAQLSDGFIALPGGFGTLEEIAEMITWSTMGLHQKPCGLLNINGFYDNLLSFFDNAVEHKFISRKQRGMVLVSSSVSDLLSKLQLSALGTTALVVV